MASDRPETAAAPAALTLLMTRLEAKLNEVPGSVWCMAIALIATAIIIQYMENRPLYGNASLCRRRDGERCVNYGTYTTCHAEVPKTDHCVLFPGLPAGSKPLNWVSPMDPLHDDDNWLGLIQGQEFYLDNKHVVYRDFFEKQPFDIHDIALVIHFDSLVVMDEKIFPSNTSIYRYSNILYQAENEIANAVNYALHEGLCLSTPLPVHPDELLNVKVVIPRSCLNNLPDLLRIFNDYHIQLHTDVSVRFVDLQTSERNKLNNFQVKAAFLSDLLTLEDPKARDQHVALNIKHFKVLKETSPEAVLKVLPFALPEDISQSFALARRIIEIRNRFFPNA